MERLEVINKMLATMGEGPLSSLEEDHEFLAAAERVLDEQDRKTQQRGYWFNTEYLTVEPNEAGQLELADDILAIRPTTRWYVKRGNRVYNTKDATAVFTSSLTMLVIRWLAWDDVAPEAQAYIASRATLKFQSEYDGDSTKARMLAAELDEARAELNAAHTRAVRYNVIYHTPRLHRLHRATLGVRRGT